MLPGLGFRIHYNSAFLSFNQNIMNIDNDIVVNEGPFEDDQDLPEIMEFIKALLELNKYHRSQWDSDCGSDSD